jgi:hypothetical protein
MKSRLAFPAGICRVSTINFRQFRRGESPFRIQPGQSICAKGFIQMDGLILAFGLLVSLLIVDILAVVFGVDSRESIFEEHNPNI